MALNPSGMKATADIEMDGVPEVIFGDGDAVRFSRIAGGLRVVVNGPASVICRIGR